MQKDGYGGPVTTGMQLAGQGLVEQLERDVLPLLDRLNRMVVRNLRTLRELKTKPINMTTANFGQLNLAQTQTNLARSADEESSGIADASGTIINSGE